MSSEGFDKSTIINSFLDEVSAYIPEIEAHLDRLQIAPDDSEAVEEAYRRTHTIAGSAAMMDFTGLAHIAQGMEVILDGALERGAALDAPTVALLRRSSRRLERVASLIRSGGSDADIVAEDDQEHAAYRGPVSDIAPHSSDSPSSAPWGSASSARADQAPPSATEIPDWLAAFGHPSLPPGNVPTTPRIPSSDFPPEAAGAAAGFQPPVAPFAAPEANDPWSATLSHQMTSARPSMPAPSAAAGFGARQDREEFIASQATAQLPANLTPTAPPAAAPRHGDGFAGVTQPPSHGAVALPAGASSALDAMRADEETVRRQAATLRDTVEMLREAAQSMESERGQLQSFLDGSHDALQRLEEWVGQQMNLDLRNSPDAVRSYLPLSVIWVTTTRLKKLITLLTSAGRNLTVTQEQMDETLAEFRSSLDTLSRFTNLFASAGTTAEGGYSATVAQVTWSPPGAGQAPGDGLSVGQRADMERSVREELRRSLEDDVRQDIAADIRREEEQRIRQELEVQLRRQMMFSSLGVGMSDSSVTVRGGAVEVRPQSRAGRRTQVTTEQSPEALEVFREEASEHLRTITDGIAELERNPGDMQTIQSVRRATHTLKGAAGMMGFVIIQRVAHASEDLLDQLAQQGRGLAPEELGLLFETAETLDQLISGVIVGPQQREIAQALIDRYVAVTGHAVERLPEEPNASTDINSSELEEPPAHAPAEDLSVRIRLSKLDELVNLFGELLVNRSIYEERVGRLNRLVEDSTNTSERLRDISAQLERRFATFMLPSGQQQQKGPLGGLPSLNVLSGLPSMPWKRGNRQAGGDQQGQGEHLQGFDALEMDRYDEFHRLNGILGEIVNDEVSLSREMSALIRELQVAFARETRLSSEVQDRLLKARLVPIRTLAPRLYRAARNSARREGKEVEFFLEGGDTEVDRKIVEEVEGPLLHLVRNSVNHGIERPEQRTAAGKPAAGKIVVSATYEGNQVLIEVQDDGRGIDPAKLRETAKARGWVDAYTTLSDREALNLIFQPGISTAESVTEESGRGVGLDVVRDAASRLKGSVEVESGVGEGAIFSLRFPISLQIARAVIVKVGASVYAIPMAVVDQIGRLDYYERVTEPTPAVVVRGERYTLVRLSTLLDLPPAPVEERASLLIVSAGRRRVALLVDGIVAQQEVVAKPLGAHLRNVRGVAGATALGNGQVVVILELLELLATPIRDDFVLPEPGSSRRDTLPSVAVPSNVRRVGGPRPAPAPIDAPPSPFAPSAPPAASWMSQAANETPAPFDPASQQPSSHAGFPAPGQPSTSLPPFLQNSGAPDTPTGQQQAGVPASLPSWLQQSGPLGGDAATPFSQAEGASTAPPSDMSRSNVAPTQPQRASATGSSRDFVVETEGRRTAKSLQVKPSYVLVVDDSPSVRTVVTGMLKANGWDTQSARDGIEALDVIGRRRPSAVLLDIEMPRMDGYELMATLRSDPQYRSLPLIVLTSRAADKHRLRAQQLGANAYVVKPYKDASLLETIAGLVQQEQSGAL